MRPGLFFGIPSTLLVQLVLISLLAIAIAAMQLLKGGWTFGYSLPAYALIALVGLLSCFRFGRIELPRTATAPLITTGIFFAYMLVRTFLAPVEHLARPDRFILLAAPLTYLVMVFYGTSPRVRSYLVGVLLLLGFANGIVGAIQYFKGENFMVLSFLPRADYGPRASGLFGNPNQLAGFLELGFLLGVSSAWWGRWKLWGRIVVGYGAAMSLVGLVLSVSRGGYVSCLGGLFVFVLLSLVVKSRKARGNMPVVVLAVVVIMGTIAFTAYSFVKGSDVVQTRVSASASDVPFRASLWAAGLKQFQISPIVGTGSGTYLYYGRMFRAPAVQSDPIYSHNDYVQLLAEYGAIGFLPFLAMLVAHLRAGWHSITDFIRNHHGSRAAGGSNSLALTIGAMSCVAAYTVHSLVDFNLHIPANAMVVAVIFALLANPGVNPVSSKTGEVSPAFRLPLLARFAVPALSVAILFFGARLAPAAYYSHLGERILSDWKYMDDPAIANEGARLMRLAIERDPQNPEYYRMLGETQFALAQKLSVLPGQSDPYFEAAIEAYKKALALAPMDRNIVLALAWSYDDMRRFSESGPLFARALELDPNSAQVIAAYGAHLQLQGKLPEAKAEYEKAFKLGSYSAYLALGKMAEDARKNPTGAEADAPRSGR